MNGEMLARLLRDVVGRVVYALESIADGDPSEAAYVLGDLERDLLAHVRAIESERGAR